MSVRCRCDSLLVRAWSFHFALWFFPCVGDNFQRKHTLISLHYYQGRRQKFTTTKWGGAKIRGHWQSRLYCVVNFLLPYLQFHFPEAKAHHYFTNDCVIRCGDYHVDPSTGYVVDAEINGTEFDLEAEDGIIGFNLSIPTSLEIGAPQRPEKDRLAPGPDDDDDSVSTLGRPRSKVSESTTSSSMSPHFHPITDTRTQRNNKCSNQDGITDDTSVMSSTSTVTWQTVASLESKISALAADSNAKFDAIMKSLGINDNNTDNRKITSENTATVDETGTSQTVKASSEAGGDTKVSSGNVS